MPKGSIRTVTNSRDNEDSGEDVETVEAGLSQDLYGAVLYRTVQCLQNGNWPQLVLSWAKMVVIILMQLFIIWTVHYNINVDSARVFQPSVGLRNWIDRLEDVTPYHRLVNTTASPQLDQVTDADLINICDALPVRWLLHVAWFLWTVVAMQEIIAVYELLKQIFLAKSLPVDEALTEGSTVIRGLSAPLKGLFFVTLVVPKLMISVALWWCGVEFLGYGMQTSDVILRIMSLKFVLTLDELVFAAFSDSDFKKELKSAKIQDKKSVLPIWIVEILRLLMAVLFCIFCEYYFDDIMELRGACHSCVHSCGRLCSNAWDYCSHDPCATAWMPSLFGCSDEEL